MNKNAIITLVLAAMLLTSCMHTYYVPNNQNVPLFKEKNEYRALVASGSGLYSSSIEIQSAYSISNKFAAMANYMFAQSGTTTTNGTAINNDYFKSNYLEGALGYYKPFDQSFVFEIFGGFGSGSQHDSYADSYNNLDGTSSLSFSKLFIQPSLGYTTKGFDISISTRFNRLSYNKINNQIDTLNDWHNQLALVAQNKSNFLIEPAITIRGGWKYVKVQMQYLQSYNLTNQNMSFDRFHYSVGVLIAITKRYRKIR